VLAAEDEMTTTVRERRPAARVQRDNKGDREREIWDVIVIGSGLGGLACAAYLAAAGKRTLVLESHYVAGGNSQTFRRERKGKLYEFDVGLHYIGECGPEGMITRVMRGAGLDGRVSYRELDPDGFSTLVFPDLTFRVPTGWERYKARLLETFPREAEALGKTVDILQQVAAEGRRLQNGEVAENDMFAACPMFFQWGIRPITELFSEMQVSERAAAVILGEQGDYAVRPSRTAVALQAGVTDHYMRGAFYPEGGGQMLAARLVEAIRAYGGEVRTRSRVQRIRVAGGKVTGVTLDRDGVEIDAPVVVSNADLKRTVNELVGREHFAPATVERVDSFRMSLPLFIVYLGVDVDYVAQGLPNTNYFMWGTYDIEHVYDQLERGIIPDEDLVYVTIASLKDPDNRRMAPAGHSNLQIMTLVPREYQVWAVDKGPAEGGYYHKDAEYRRRKHELVERLMASAERVLPGLRDHVDWQESATPVTQERFTRSTGGTSYGIEFATDQMGPMRYGPETEVGGLYLTGASMPSGHGIGSVLRGGVVTAGRILGSDLLRQIGRGDVLGDPALLPDTPSDYDPWRESH
jgi:all-trans-retinol 13,14-reductase